MLPEGDRIEWPPPSMEAIYEELYEHAAWYSGDPGQIQMATGTPEGWGHVPLPGDLASVSSDLLFSEAPGFEAEEEALATAALDLLEAIALQDSLMEAAEVASALGGVYLVPRWALGVRERAYVATVHPDAAIPSFRAGKLSSVIFWRELARSASGRIIVRHLESHDVTESGRCVITHAVYEGKADELGQRVALAGYEAMEGIEDEVDTGIEGRLDAQYVPNLRPNRRHRNDQNGRSDFQGIEWVFASLDQAYSSWMQDIDLGRSKIVVPEEWLERRKGSGATFDLDQKIFVSLPIDPSQREKFGAQHIQPTLRTAEHEQTALHLIERAVTTLYSPQTFGLHIEGRAESGTALKIRERRTYLTQAKKQRQWGPAIAALIENLLTIDTKLLSQDVPVGRPKIIWPEITGEDIGGIANTVETLDRAGAISTEQKVRMVNPNWDEEDIQAEVDRISEERGSVVESPVETGAFG